MVEVGDKPVVRRTAEAEGKLRLAPATLDRVRRNDLRKGDALATARAAGVLAAKRVPDLLPFCHPLPLTGCDVRLEVGADAVVARATVTSDGKTGVEMEALAAVTIALLTVWDLVKEHEKDASGNYPATSLEGVRVVRKEKAEAPDAAAAHAPPHPAGSARHPHAPHAHEHGAPRRIRCAVLTVSDTRRKGADAGGDAVQAALEAAGHEVVLRAWARDDVAEVRRETERSLDAGVGALLVTGGTGVSPRDVTPEALAPLVEKRLDGFAEAFRRASEADVGGRAWLSRAGAGVAKGTVVAWLPGAPAAAALGARLLAEELRHLVALLGREA